MAKFIHAGRTFIKGFLAAIVIHGLVLLGLESSEAAWHFFGHTAGVAVLTVITGH